jgi:hypothetical protein
VSEVREDDESNLGLLFLEEERMADDLEVSGQGVSL